MDEDDIIESEDVAPLSDESLFGQFDEDPTGDPEDIVDFGADELAALEEEEYFEQREFGTTWQFDFANSRFVVRGSSAQVAQTTDKQAFAQWVMTSLSTERFTAFVCSDQFGIEFESIVKNGYSGALASSVIYQAVDEALGIHDRYNGISSFESSQSGDFLVLNMVVETTEGGQVQIERRIRL